MSCCQPAPSPGESAARPGQPRPRPRAAGPGNAPDGMPRHGIEQVRVPAGSYLMGDHFGEGYPDDGETPVHRVAVAEFGMDAVAVTNRQFAQVRGTDRPRDGGRTLWLIGRVPPAAG